MTSIPTRATYAAALRVADAIPVVPLGYYPTPLEEMPGLRAALGAAPRLWVKRDDIIAFGFGGNKVRKLQYVAAQALAEGANVLITVGGVQSNHARATAAVAAKLGLRCVLVVEGDRPEHPRANALLHTLLGAEMEYVRAGTERTAAMHVVAERLRRAGERPCIIPRGASTPVGAIGFVRAVGEMVAQGPPPDVIVHTSSSGATQAGLMAGCILHDLKTRVIGVTIDDPAFAICANVVALLAGVASLLGLDGAAFAAARPIEVDDRFIGTGYGMPTAGSVEAQELAARTEALFVDHTYTAKSLAAVVAYVREGLLGEGKSILFWHTGGQVGLFA